MVGGDNDPSRNKPSLDSTGFCEWWEGTVGESRPTPRARHPVGLDMYGLLLLVCLFELLRSVCPFHLLGLSLLVGLSS